MAEERLSLLEQEGAVHAARGGGASVQATNAFAGVSGLSWADDYADGCVPHEQLAVSAALAAEVQACSGCR